MTEIWKDIIGYSGYQVSNLGRIRTHNKTTLNSYHCERKWKDRIMKLKVSKKDNCSRVELWSNGIHKTCLVHRLVAYAFLGKPENDEMTVNHKDGNRLNNCVDNLEWLSRADNIRHGFQNNLYPQDGCILIDDQNNHYQFTSLTQASFFLNRNHGYISNHLKKNKKITNSNGEKFDVILLKSIQKET